MRPYVIAFLLLLGFFAPPRSIMAQEQQVLIIPAGQRYEGDLATVTQHIRIDGEVTGDVTSWSGNIVVTGSVGGDVVSYAGTVTIGGQARVQGHVMVLGENLQLEHGAAIGGQAFQGGSSAGALASLLGLLAPSPEAEMAPLLSRGLFGIALGVLLIGFSLLCIAFWPHRTANTGLTLQQLPTRALLLGFGTTIMLALLLVPVAAFLAASLIGLPLLLLGVLLLQLPYIYGLAAFAQMAGMRFRRQPGLLAEIGTSTALSALGVAMLIALGGVISPPFGLLLFYILASPGLGAVILSRGGMLVPADARL